MGETDFPASRSAREARAPSGAAIEPRARDEVVLRGSAESVVRWLDAVSQAMSRGPVASKPGS